MKSEQEIGRSRSSDKRIAVLASNHPLPAFKRTVKKAGGVPSSRKYNQKPILRRPKILRVGWAYIHIYPRAMKEMKAEERRTGC
jgi:hypothetical protein